MYIRPLTGHPMYGKWFDCAQFDSKKFDKYLDLDINLGVDLFLEFLNVQFDMYTKFDI
jgi:hypothetical protein